MDDRHAKAEKDGEVLAGRPSVVNSTHRIFTPSRSTYHQKLTIIPIHNMGVPFDYAPERPEHIDAILNGLDRYNPETTTVFQDYVVSQCENQTYDCYANLALLKLCVPFLLYDCALCIRALWPSSEHLY